MAGERKDRYRTAELVIHFGSRGAVGSLFAVEHVSGRQKRRLLARNVLGPRGRVTSQDELVEALSACLAELTAGQYTPPR